MKYSKKIHVNPTIFKCRFDVLRNALNFVLKFQRHIIDVNIHNRLDLGGELIFSTYKPLEAVNDYFNFLNLYELDPLMLETIENIKNYSGLTRVDSVW